MAIVFDAVILIIIVLSVIFCIKRGFVGSLFKSLGFITAVFCALMLTPVFSSFLKGAFVEDFSFMFVRSVVCKTEDNRGFDNVLADIVEKNPEVCSGLEHLGLNVAEIEQYAKSLESTDKEEAMELLVKKIATPMCSLISDVMAFMITFGVIFLIVKLLAWLLDKAVKLPTVKTVDRVLGGVYGVLLGTVRSGIFIMVVAAAYPMIGAYITSIPTFDAVSSETVLFEFFANYNILSLLINTFI